MYDRIQIALANGKERESFGFTDMNSLKYNVIMNYS